MLDELMGVKGDEQLDRHDLCLFAFDMDPEITDSFSLAIAVEDIL